jgi:hypothetical protein
MFLIVMQALAGLIGPKPVSAGAQRKTGAIEADMGGLGWHGSGPWTCSLPT